MPGPASVSDLRSKLIVERTKLLQAFADLTPADLLRVDPGQDWSIRDLIAHVAVSEQVNVEFAQKMLTEDEPAQLAAMATRFPDYPGEFQLDKFNAWMLARTREQTLEAAIAALHGAREKTLAWLDTLSPEQLGRTGVHAAWGPLTVAEILRVLALHDKMHAADIRKRRQ